MEKSATTIINDASLAATDTGLLADCTAIDLGRAVQLICAVQATFHASATSGLTVKFYPSTDNVTYDTAAWDTWEIAVTAGSTIQEHYVPSTPTPMYLKARVTNNDAARAVTNLKVIATQMDV